MSRPEASGSWISTRATSNSPRLSAAVASEPDDASSTDEPLRESTLTRRPRTSASSSTTRT
jgi:hypothetical protein